MYHVISYGADPTGKTDSTEALLEAMSAAFQGPSHGDLMEGIVNLGGARIDLQGGHYLISRPLRFPDSGAGNLMVCSHHLSLSLSLSSFFFSLLLSLFYYDLFGENRSLIYMFAEIVVHLFVFFVLKETNFFFFFCGKRKEICWLC